jgi:hypothetical protein
MLFGSKITRAFALGAALSLLAGPALAGGTTHARFTAIMNQVFGAGAWRMTGGYRTPERENELRAQGAKTVRPGGVSPHSLGSRNAPGAYDLVVDGMSPYEAAARLRRAGAPFARYVPKGAHGSQGPHLHLEPYSYDLLASGPAGKIVGERGGDSGLPVVLAGFRRSSRAEALADVSEPDDAPAAATPAAQALAKLRTLAMNDRPEAQLALGMAYAKGLNTPRDLGAARAWLELAASNPKTKDETYKAASAALAEVKDQLEIDGALQVRRLARRAAEPTLQKTCAATPKGRGLPAVIAMADDCGPATSKGRAGIVVMSGGR